MSTRIAADGTPAILARVQFTLMLALCCGAAHAAPVAQLQASRTSGPAPLAVFFDATGTTDTTVTVDAFRQLGYRFEFGDAGSGTWTHSGQSKNVQTGGPLAAHVFEQPGTFTVRLTVANSSGVTSTATATITVENPDTVFSGTNTVCVSRTSDFAGCPAGAQQVATLPSIQANRRYLLHRGQDFGSGVSIGNLTNVQVGAFGTGALPVVGNVNVSGNSMSRVVVMDLSCAGIFHSGTGNNLLLLRNNLAARGGIIEFANGVSSTNPDGIFLVENTVDRNFSAPGQENPNGITGQAVRLVLAGNSVDRTLQHNIRLWQGHKVFIGHNYISSRTGDEIRHALKIHAAGLNAIGSSGQRSSELVVANNVVGHESAILGWRVVLGPQAPEIPEGLERAIVENNRFSYGTSRGSDVVFGGRNMSERGNVNTRAGGAANHSIRTTTALPSDWQGPYYWNDTRVDQFFGSTVARPMSPVLTGVQ